MRHPRTILSASVAIALMITGCDHKAPGGTKPPSTDAASATTSAAPAIPNLITEQTAGKPPLKLKLGDSASFTKGGATLTLIPKSYTPVNGSPDGLDKAKENCGSWWKLDAELKIDVQANSTWDGWMLNFNSPLAEEGKPHLYEGQYIGSGDSALSAISENQNDLARLLNKAAYDFDANRKQEFHRDLIGVSYDAACKEDNGHKESFDFKPTFIAWKMQIDPNDHSLHWPQLAVWFL